ncbi:polymorphic toxin-type HINT domain-containing protein [Actinokineospora sp. UTMC 2448]|uniref:polymorphic toxin-type HINT domain-containing protein n=1 Tax=Actinokineospora sp. UTMC 2448 TaxID=2268449 RepID=UPI002164920E|nr:polymorphic toxin-type HINT domain-containing protein [Actinokineospora sp. UTMC 2448]UVS82253.1 Ribonuclease precursor [Actinokineospora sp. UTMC 2448]
MTAAAGTPPVPSKWQPTKRYDKEIPGGRKAGKGDVPSGAKAAPNPRKANAAAAAAAARRAAAARAAYLAAVARTAKAKAAVAYAVKRNPMPVLKSMLKPTMANPKNLVSAVANAPARYVQQAVSNVPDVNRVYDKIYDTMLGVGHEVVKEAAETAAAEVMAGSGIPMLDGVVDLLDRRKKGPSEQGKTARGTATNGSCSASSKAQLNSNSFTGDTPVLLADGTRKPIKDMRVGDVVLATDPTTGESGPRVVTDVRSHQSERLLYEITVDTADGTGKITATDEHPFWVESLQKWVHAEDLKPGYTFKTADHRPATVAGVRPLSERRQVYNLTVDDLHTYYVSTVGANAPIGVLVHNDDDHGEVCRRPGLSAKRHAQFAEQLRTAEIANPVVDSLRQTGALPSNYVTKDQAKAAGWKPGKALNNHVPGGQIGGDVFENSDSQLPDVAGRVWYEADIGLTGGMSRAKQPGTRLTYSNDGLAYVTHDHYKTYYRLPNWR